MFRGNILIIFFFLLKAKRNIKGNLNIRGFSYIFLMSE